MRLTPDNRWLRILNYTVILVLWTWSMALAGQESTSTKSSEESESTRSNLKEWKKIVLREKEVTSKVKFAESLASGLSIFAIGLYGSETDKEQSITSGIYSFLQTGGLIVASKGIQTYLEGSVVLDMRKFYSENDKMTKRQMHQIWTDHAVRAEYAANVADLVLWSSLSGVYLRAGLSQPKKSATSRSIYFFLSGNSFILGSVALYKIINREPISREESKWSVGASSSGVALEWKSAF
jgi:hypothetical protein